MEQQHTFQLTYTTTLLQTLKTIAFWAKLTAICAFISAGISFIGGLRDIATLIGGLIGTAISIVINVFLLQFANAVQKGLANNDNYKVSEGFTHLKTYYKIYGILAIIGFSLILLVLVISVIAGIFAAGSK